MKCKVLTWYYFMFQVTNDCSGGTVERIKDSVETMFRIESSSADATAMNHPVEVATEVIEEENTLTSPSERDSYMSYCKRRDLVSSKKRIKIKNNQFYQCQ